MTQTFLCEVHPYVYFLPQCVCVCVCVSACVCVWCVWCACVCVVCVCVCGVVCVWCVCVWCVCVCVCVCVGMCRKCCFSKRFWCCIKFTFTLVQYSVLSLFGGLYQLNVFSHAVCLFL